MTNETMSDVLRISYMALHGFVPEFFVLVVLHALISQNFLVYVSHPLLSSFYSSNSPEIFCACLVVMISQPLRSTPQSPTTESGPFPTFRVFTSGPAWRSVPRPTFPIDCSVLYRLWLRIHESRRTFCDLCGLDTWDGGTASDAGGAFAGLFNQLTVYC